MEFNINGQLNTALLLSCKYNNSYLFTTKHNSKHVKENKVLSYCYL